MKNTRLLLIFLPLLYSCSQELKSENNVIFGAKFSNFIEPINSHQDCIWYSDYGYDSTRIFLSYQKQMCNCEYSRFDDFLYFKIHENLLDPYATQLVLKISKSKSLLTDITLIANYNGGSNQVLTNPKKIEYSTIFVDSIDKSRIALLLDLNARDQFFSEQGWMNNSIFTGKIICQDESVSDIKGMEKR